jgi:hypothetical protein
MPFKAASRSRSAFALSRSVSSGLGFCPRESRAGVFFLPLPGAVSEEALRPGELFFLLSCADKRFSFIEKSEQDWFLSAWTHHEISDGIIWQRAKKGILKEPAHCLYTIEQVTYQRKGAFLYLLSF